MLRFARRVLARAASALADAEHRLDLWRAHLLMVEVSRTHRVPDDYLAIPLEADEAVVPVTRVRVPEFVDRRPS